MQRIKESSCLYLVFFKIINKFFYLFCKNVCTERYDICVAIFSKKLYLFYIFQKIFVHSIIIQFYFLNFSKFFYLSNTNGALQICHSKVHSNPRMDKCAAMWSSLIPKKLYSFIYTLIIC